MESVPALISAINKEIINPLIYLLFALAIAFFIYGIVEFLMNIESEEGRSKGKKHMIWAIVGLTVMVSVWGILGIALGTFGISVPE